jgi:hypothetical protein
MQHTLGESGKQYGISVGKQGVKKPTSKQSRKLEHNIKVDII